VLVLGGGSDIGLALARELVKERARTVVLAARRPDELTAQIEELRSLGATECEAVAFDALDTDSHELFLKEAFAKHGDVDLAIVAFGVLGQQKVAESDPAQALELARTNYVGVVSVLLPLARLMREQGHGQIVHISSVSGERARKSNFIYGSSKAGSDALAQGLADSLYGSGVEVLVVRPGFVKDKMTAGRKPMPLSTTPEEVAKVTIAGLKRGSATVWAPAALRYAMTVVRYIPRTIFRKLNF
jgi:decaprenylphospho-beta-D-erythro-pentofuranosid-2-ulose 2-reductase